MFGTGKSADCADQCNAIYSQAMDNVLCSSWIVSLDTNDGTAQYGALDILDIQIVFRHLFHGVRRHVVLAKSYLISYAVDPATWHVAHRCLMLKSHISLWFLSRSTSLLDNGLRNGRALHLDQPAWAKFCRGLIFYRGWPGLNIIDRTVFSDHFILPLPAWQKPLHLLDDGDLLLP